MMAFRRATRARIPLKIALMGPSGSGKTYSALLLAQGFGGKIAFIDTENGSGSLYSDMCEYDVLELAPPFNPEKYADAITEAVKGEYSTVIIDSFSHAWRFLLDYHDSLPGNSFTNWGVVKPRAEALKRAILQSPLNVLACMRSKTEYVLEADDRGKQVPKKVGMAAVQEPDVEYEFTVVFPLDMTHRFAAPKDRTGLFADTAGIISVETGKQIMAWRESGAELKPIAAPVLPVPEPVPAPNPRGRYFAVHGKLGWPTHDAAESKAINYAVWAKVLGRAVISGSSLSDADWRTIADWAEATERGDKATPKAFREWVAPKEEAKPAESNGAATEMTSTERQALCASIGLHAPAYKVILSEYRDAGRTAADLLEAVQECADARITGEQAQLHIRGKLTQPEPVEADPVAEDDPFDESLPIEPETAPRLIHGVPADQA